MPSPLPQYSEMPLTEAVPLWLSTREVYLRPNTLSRYREFARKLTSHFGATPLAEITADNIRDYQRHRLETVAGTTINKETGILAKVLKRARLWKNIEDDFQRLPQRESTVGYALTKEQFANLLQVASQKSAWWVVYRAAIISAFTSAGKSELLGVRVGDIDVEKKLLFIRHGKNKFRTREIPLNEYALEAVSALLDRANRLGATKPEHYLFPRPCIGGRSLTSKRHDPTQPQKSFREVWRSLTRKAGLPGFRFHNLRHLCATDLLESGTPEAVAMEMTGHIRREMIMHYSHQRREAKRTAVDAIAEKYRDVFTSPARPDVPAAAPTATGTWTFWRPLQ